MEGDIAIDISVIESLYAFLRYREHISQIAHSDHLLKFMIVQFLKCKIRRYLIMLVRYIMTDARHIAYPILPDEGIDWSMDEIKRSLIVTSKLKLEIAYEREDK